MSHLDDMIDSMERRTQERMDALEKKAEEKVSKALGRLLKEDEPKGSSGPESGVRPEPKIDSSVAAPPPSPSRQSNVWSRRAFLPASTPKRIATWRSPDLDGNLSQRPARHKPQSDEKASRKSNTEDILRESFRNFVVSPEEMAAIAGLVFHNRVVTGNSAYRKRAAATTFLYCEADVVNAFATDAPLELEGAQRVAPPAIVVFSGLSTAVNLTAAGLACHAENGQPFARPEARHVLRNVGKTILKQKGTLGVKAAHGLAQKLKLHGGLNGSAERHARSIASGTFLSIIAHELGHICLSHTLGDRLGRQENEVRRHQERQADLFASSVLTTTPFSDYAILGAVLFWLLLTWVETAASPSEPSTHPVSLERLFDCIRDHQEQVAELGITPETIAECVPQEAVSACRNLLR